MDYEKKYKEALERAKNFIENGDETERTIAESIFAGIMEESEDERIRKALMQNLKERFGTKGNMGEGLDMPHVLAWLERQGEQKLNVNDNAKEMFIKALERVEEQNAKGYKLTDCDKNSWWEDFKAYTSCTIAQNNAWSEDDEKQARQIERIVHDDGCTQKLQKQIADWLKSIKERVQPKQEWSEEDERLKGWNNNVRNSKRHMTLQEEDFNRGKHSSYLEILNFIDSLQEEPVSNPIDFEKELYKAFGQVKDFTLGMRIAKWFYDMGKNSQEPVSEDLKEAYERYVDERMVLLRPDIADMSCDRDTKMSFDIFDGSEVEAALYEGALWQKQQLMAKAIDVTVHIDAGGYPYIPQMELYDYDKDVPLAKEGEKVKVIVIKEG